MNANPKCSATSAKTGNPCRNAPVKGEEFCRQHLSDRPQGRPVKIDAEVIRRIETALYAGISEASFYSYLERGEADQENEVEDSKYVEFLEAVTRAESQAEIYAVATLRTAMSEDWRAAAWFMERRRPSDWGRSERHEIKHSGSVQTEVPELPETAERMEEVARVLRDSGVLPDG